MFMIRVTYTKPIEVIEKHVAAHRAFLDEGYQNDYFVVSGPQNPRVGGIIISQLKNRDQLEAILKNDPYLLNDVAEYEVVEFEPVKYHKNFAGFVA